ncbi:unnamed protein product [Oikopleura dioica]|uniref:Uncharacterized protein n=1 Tax=Oikopleura dioica TaxID=34765 RepID=E4XYS3_OIKDI|nr:unnamed protein product [Oikopleura dioica]
MLDTFLLEFFASTTIELDCKAERSLANTTKESDSESDESNNGFDNDLTEIIEIESSDEIDEIIKGFGLSELNDEEIRGELPKPNFPETVQKLTSYDKLELTFNQPQKRRRDSREDSFEIPETKQLKTQTDLNNTIVMDSDILNDPVKLPKMRQRGYDKDFFDQKINLSRRV